MRRALWAVVALAAAGLTGCMVSAVPPTGDVRLSASQACVDTFRRAGFWVQGVQAVNQVGFSAFDVVASVQAGPYTGPRLCRFDADTGRTWLPRG